MNAEDYEWIKDGPPDIPLRDIIGWLAFALFAVFCITAAIVTHNRTRAVDVPTIMERQAQ